MRLRLLGKLVLFLQRQKTNVPGFLTAGLTCDLIQSLSLQSLPFSHASVLSTTPLSAVATGDGWEYRHCELVHLIPNLHNVGDCGRSGRAYAGFRGALDDTALAGSGMGAAIGVDCAGSAITEAGTDTGVGTSSIDGGAGDEPMCPPREPPRPRPPLAAPRPLPFTPFCGKLCPFTPAPPLNIAASPPCCIGLNPGIPIPGLSMPIEFAICAMRAI